MGVLAKAIYIAANAHVVQTDRGGHPYILHPLRVMMRLRSVTERDIARMQKYMHAFKRVEALLAEL